ncbi:MAG: hypothetical protein GY835_24555 [bacterium]|nr:hypothetical protein [bacterium]
MKLNKPEWMERAEQLRRNLRELDRTDAALTEATQALARMREAVAKGLLVLGEARRAHVEAERRTLADATEALEAVQALADGNDNCPDEVCSWSIH